MIFLRQIHYAWKLIDKLRLSDLTKENQDQIKYTASNYHLYIAHILSSIQSNALHIKAIRLHSLHFTKSKAIIRIKDNAKTIILPVKNQKYKKSIIK